MGKIFRSLSCNGILLVVKLCTFIVQVSGDTDIIEMVGMYSENGLEIAIQEWGRLHTFIVKISGEIDLIELVGLYSEDDLEIAIQKWERLHIHFNFSGRQSSLSQ